MKDHYPTSISNYCENTSYDHCQSVEAVGKTVGSCGAFLTFHQAKSAWTASLPQPTGVSPSAMIQEAFQIANGWNRNSGAEGSDFFTPLSVPDQFDGIAFFSVSHPLVLLNHGSTRPLPMTCRMESYDRHVACDDRDATLLQFRRRESTFM